MPKKHSSNFFRSYFTAPTTGEVKSPDRDAAVSADLEHGKPITAPAKPTVSAGGSIHTEAGTVYALGPAADPVGPSGLVDLEVKTR